MSDRMKIAILDDYQNVATSLADWGSLDAESMRAGGWQVSLGEGLHGKTLGILGLGRVGTGVARVGQAFGMKTIAWSQNLTPEAAAEHGVRAVTKEQLFAESDVLSIHVL